MRTRTRSKGSHVPILGLKPGIATVAVVGFLVALAGPATADTSPGPLVTVSVTGTMANVVVDDNGPAAWPREEGATEVEAFVEVAGELFDLPDGTVVPPSSTGVEVVITLAAPRGATGVEALELAADDVKATEARVLDVQPVLEGASAGATADSVVADAVVGNHTLTVLPVYWTTPDVSGAALGTLATQTVDYWREQSGGRLSITPSVRAWAPIAAPGSCDSASLTAIFNAAMAANPSVLAPTSTNHVLVYFPRFAACPFAGRATLGGGYVWDNGYTYVDVAAHELGHNLGLGHANLMNCTSGGARVPLSGSCSTTEYGDYADVMGIAMSRTTGNLNTALADALGYANVTAIPAGSGTTTLTLAPLADVGAARGVKLQVPTGTVYIDFRPASGRDVRMPAWAGVQVHLRTTDGRGIPTTYLLDMQPTGASTFVAPSLVAGATWVVPDTGLAVTVTGIGATATVQIAPTILLEQYVNHVYADLFNRVPDPQGLQTWTAALRAGTPRIAVANAITYSDEYRSGLIGEAYSRFLGRAPEAAGLAFWLVQMGRGMTIQQMEGGFLASPEYFQQSGNDDSRWVSRLYSHVLGRGATSAEVQAWLPQVSSGNRGPVAMGFLLSTERLTSDIDGQYQLLLARSIDPSGRQSWVGQIQSGVRLEAVIGGIIASEEYFGRC